MESKRRGTKIRAELYVQTDNPSNMADTISSFDLLSPSKKKYTPPTIKGAEKFASNEPRDKKNVHGSTATKNADIKAIGRLNSFLERKKVRIIKATPAKTDGKRTEN